MNVAKATDDQLLAELVARGPYFQESATELVRRHQPWLQHLVGYLFPNLPADAPEDISQSAFALFFLHASTLQAPGLRGWLRQVAWRLAISEYRRQTRGEKKVVSAGEIDLDTFQDGGPSPEETVILADILSHLPEEERTIFLAHADGASAREIAENLGWYTPSKVPALGRVYAALERATRQLRRLLEEQF